MGIRRTRASVARVTRGRSDDPRFWVIMGAGTGAPTTISPMFMNHYLAERIGMPESTVSLICKRAGLGRLPRLGAEEPANRYGRAPAGELVHVDVKKLGRISRPGYRITGNRRGRVHDNGWECVHVLVDDATRIA